MVRERGRGVKNVGARNNLGERTGDGLGWNHGEKLKPESGL